MMSVFVINHDKCETRRAAPVGRGTKREGPAGEALPLEALLMPCRAGGYSGMVTWTRYMPGVEAASKASWMWSMSKVSGSHM